MSRNARRRMRAEGGRGKKAKAASAPQRRSLELEPLEPRVLLSGGLEQPALELFSVSPALFVENQGQWSDPSVYYVHDGSGADVAMTDSRLVFQVFRAAETDASDSSSVPPEGSEEGLEPAIQETEVLQFSASFVGANSVRPVGLEPSATVFNYFIGDEADWRENVASYAVVAYEGLYEGIDLAAWGQRDSLKYEFRIEPGAEYGQIAVRYDGIAGLSLSEDGSLVVNLGGDWGSLTDDTPQIYQVINGQRVDVAGQFVLLDSATYGFVITGDYDATHDLVIDPDLAWATYLGGTSDDDGFDIAADGAGNAYVAGRAGSGGFTGGSNDGGTNNSYKGGTYSTDAFVAKLNSAGALAWATYLGGSGTDYANGVAMDGAGNAYVTGTTAGGFTGGSNNGGTNNSYKGGSYDAFVAKLNPAGALTWATYLGGSGLDYANAIAVDGSGNPYVTGKTGSGGFTGGSNNGAPNNGFRAGSMDAFVAKLNPAGSLTWATYLGGSGYDCADGIAADGAGNAYVTGTTAGGFTGGSNNGGTNNSYKGGSYDAFVAKLNPAGSLTWATYLGGSSYDWGLSIAADGSGEAHVTGTTAGGFTGGSNNGGTNNSFKGGNQDAFVAKLNSAGALTWATYLGGGSNDVGNGIAVDGAANAYVTGYTAGGFTGGSNNGGTNNSFKGGNDAFVAKLDSAGALTWATYLGGSSNDYGYGIAADGSGNAYVTGTTDGGFTGGSNNGGTNNSFKGGNDAFVAKLYGVQNSPPVADSGGPYLVDFGSNLVLNGSASSDPDAGDSIVLYQWDLRADGSFEYAGVNPTVPWAVLAGFPLGMPVNVRLLVADTSGAVGTDMGTITVYLNQPHASFTANPNPAGAGQAISFDASASSAGRPDRSIVSYEWDFGDGLTASGVQVSHTYAQFGAYDVTLTVTDDNSPARTDTQTLAISVSQGNQHPIAEAGGPYVVDFGSDLVLDGTASTDPNIPDGDSIVLYEWDLAVDGIYDYTGATPTVPWSALSGFSPGTPVDVRLTVTDQFGASGTDTTTIRVNSQPVADAGGPYTISEGDQLALDASGSYDPDGDPLSFAWDLDGDGQYGDAAGATVSLSWSDLQGLGIVDDGSFSVAVRAIDGTGLASTSTADLTVTNAAPTIALSGPVQVNEGAPYTLTLGAVSDPGNDTVTGYTVNWGDGTSTSLTAEEVAADPSVLHTYNYGTVNRTITVDLTDEDGTHAGAGSLSLTVSNVGPTDYLVDTLLDENDGDYSAGDLSLREAIGLANSQADANEIVFAPALFSSGGRNDIDLTLGQLTISSPLAIQGPGQDLLYIDGQNSTQIFSIGSGAEAQISGLTIYGGRANTGGGLYINHSSVTLSDVTFRANDGSNGGGMYTDNYSSALLSNVIFIGNTAAWGGGMYNSWHCSLALNNVTFAGNTAAGGGGGMMNTYSCSATLCNVIFVGNSANVVYNEFSCSPTITNATFVGNTGALIHNSVSCRPVVSNSIVWGNTDQGGLAIYDGPTDCYTEAVYCLIEGRYPGEGNMNADPLFVRDPSPGPDGTWGTADDDYGDLRLQAGSPAIDAGSNALLPTDAADLDGDGNTGEGLPVDLDGNPRLVGRWVDLGAYEDFYAPLPTADKPVVAVREGQTASNSGQFIDLNSPQVSLTASVGTVNDSGGGRWIWSYATSGAPNVSQVVTITATDSDGAVTSEWFELRVAPSAYVVDTLVDESDGNYGPGALSLREAVEFANATPEADEITFDSALAGQTIVLGGHSLDICSNLAINGLGPGQLAIDAAGLSRVFYVTDRDCVPNSVDVSINGLTIKGGQAEDGGAIYSVEALTVTDCVFAGNSASFGGAIYCHSGSPMLNDVAFSANNATYGAGMHLEYRSSPTLSNVIFSSNTGGRGSGIYNNGSSPMLTNVTFSGNSADLGAGMFNTPGSSPTLDAVTFTSNSATRGGGMFNDSASPVLRNVAFIGNAASLYGGGMLNQSGLPALSNVTFSGNTAAVRGGAIYNQSSSPTLSNVTLYGNSASDGGAIYNYYRSSPSLTNVTFGGNVANRGGGVYNNASSPIVTNSTFSSNSATSSGGGMYNSGSSPTVNNSVMWGNTAPTGPAIYDGTPTVSYSIIQGGWAGEGNLNADPLFVRNPSPGADGRWDGVDDDYGDLRLQSTSPAIGAGSNALLPPDATDLDGDGDASEPLPVDLDGNPRLVGLSVDMGAYEVQNRPPVLTVDQDTVTVGEGQPAIVSGTFSDPDLGDVVGLAASVGTIVEDEATGTWSWTYTPADGPDASQVVTLTATDSMGASASASFQLTVNNAAPTVVVQKPVVTVVEGQTAVNGGTFGDPGLDTVSLTASAGTVTDNGNGTWSWSLSTAGMPDIAQGVTITATDSDGAATSASFELRVAPTAHVVSTLVDESDGDYRAGDLSLREAVELANATPEDDTITFSAALAGQTIVLGGQQIDVTSNITVAGLGPDQLTIDGAGLSRIFYIDGTNGPSSAGLAYCAETGHYYELIEQPGISWDDAMAAAEARFYLGSAGHLATIASAAEDSFIRDTILGSAVGDHYWLGGYQPENSPEPDGNWQWVTGESWDYQDWNGGEPNNVSGGTEDVLMVYSAAYPYRYGRWNDAPRDADYSGGYIVEFDSPKEGVQVSISGMTLTGGHADNGGAIFLNQAQLTLSDAAVADNHVPGKGGGIYAGSSWAVLSNVTFSSNTAGGLGGGMYNYYSSGTLSDVTFSANTSGSSGGGMCNWTYCSPTLSNVVFDSNRAARFGGGMYNVSYSSPQLSSVIFSRNSANNGGGMANQSFSSGSLTEVIFVGNTALDGGGMWNDLSSSPLLDDVIFGGNVANGGGGMSNEFGSCPTLANVVFIANRANWGGGIYNFSSSPTLTQVTFSSNAAAEAGGAMYSYYGSCPILSNIVVWDNTAPMGAGLCDALGGDYPVSSTGATYSLIEGGWAGEGNLDADPLFVRNPSPGADGTWGGTDDDYGDLRLQAGSPAIDAGSNALLPLDTADLDSDGDTTEPLPLDLDGNPRVVGAAVDMGAYEVQNRPPVLTVDQSTVAVDEGQPVSVSGTFSDPDLGDVVSLVAWVGTIAKDDATGTWSWSYTPADGPDESQMVTLTATDSMGASASASFQLTVSNVAPTIQTFVAPGAGDEGAVVTVSATASDPAGANDTLSFAWTVRDPGGEVVATGAGTTFAFTPGDDGNYQVQLDVSDEDRGVTTATTTVNVSNVKPTIFLDEDSAQIVDMGSYAAFSASGYFTDPGLDTWTATVDYGDGTGLRPLTLNADGTFTLSYDYSLAQPKAFQVTVTVADDDGGSDTHRGDKLYVLGTIGNDQIEVKYGSTIVIVNGEQIVETDDVSSVVVLGGQGDDLITIDPAVTVNAELYGGEGNDTLVAGGGPSLLVGGADDDILTGGSALTILQGGHGQDTLIAGTGDAVLDGGAGDDVMVGGAGLNTVIGGEGSNTYVSGGGQDEFQTTPGSTKPEGFTDGYQTDEDVPLVVTAEYGLLANDQNPLEGDLIAELVAGPAKGSVTLNDEGSFTYTPGASSNGTDSFTYRASNGTDVSDPVTVAIQITKAVEDGQVTVDSQGIVRIGGTAGNDVIRAAATSGGQYLEIRLNGTVVSNSIPLASVSAIRAWGRDGDDTIDVSDIVINTFLSGGSGRDTLTGGLGDDLIIGGAGDDIITGASGNDFLIGGDGSDRIVGSAGNDILVAGDVDSSLSMARLRAILANWVLYKDPDDEEGDDVLDETLVTDVSYDMLTGSSGADWFIINQGDKVTDFKSDNKQGDFLTVL